jgi:pyrimidine operon attenuation protein/uracil phosphoribosyltransferase
METVLNANQMDATLAALAQRLLDDPGIKAVPAHDIVLVGIRSRGELIAQRLAAVIQKTRNITLSSGALDITMYRDDLRGRRAITIPQGTDLPFSLDGKFVILTDDVLETGRSVRAALDALVDFGRPRTIRLLTLIDRGRREYPIAADYTGMVLETVAANQRVIVRLRPTDGEDGVYLENG